MNNVNVYLALLWISSHFHWHYQSAACHSFFSFGSIVFSFCGACLAHQLLVVAMAHSWNVLSFNCWALYRKEGWVEIQKKLWGLWSGRRMHMWDAMKYIHSVRNPSPLPKQGHPIWSGDIAVYTCYRWQMAKRMIQQPELHCEFPPQTFTQQFAMPVPTIYLSSTPDPSSRKNLQLCWSIYAEDNCTNYLVNPD